MECVGLCPSIRYCAGPDLALGYESPLQLNMGVRPLRGHEREKLVVRCGILGNRAGAFMSAASGAVGLQRSAAVVPPSIRLSGNERLPASG